MPRYDFKCTCGEEFETSAPVGAITTLCICGKEAKRIYSMPFVSLKGKGWTTNDKINKEQDGYIDENLKDFKNKYG